MSDIVERLKDLIPDGYGHHSDFSDTMDVAATEIETLRSQNKLLVEALEIATMLNYSREAIAKHAKAALATVKGTGK